MSAKPHGRALRAVGLAGLLAMTPVVAACGGSANTPAGSVSGSIGTGGAGVSVSPSLPSITPTISNGTLQVGQTATVTGTVAQIVIPQHLFLLHTTQSSVPVPVAGLSLSSVTKGERVTVTGTVAKINIKSLTKQFNFTPPAALRNLNNALVINASSVKRASSSSS